MTAPQSHVSQRESTTDGADTTESDGSVSRQSSAGASERTCSLWRIHAEM